ncbi:MAG: hypothetical protein ACFFDS_00635 [Candidatus Thorarchaeota archaeon]
MVLEIITGIYSLTVGISLIGFWAVFYLRKELNIFIENSLERFFHILAEIIISILALISGIAILANQSWGLFIYILTMGFLIYASINAIGIYGKKKIWWLVILLAVVALMSTALVIVNMIIMF